MAATTLDPPTSTGWRTAAGVCSSTDCLDAPLRDLLIMADFVRSGDQWLREQRVSSMISRIKSGLEWFEREVLSGAPYDGAAGALGNVIFDTLLLVAVADRDFGANVAGPMLVSERACAAARRRCPGAAAEAAGWVALSTPSFTPAVSSTPPRVDQQSSPTSLYMATALEATSQQPLPQESLAAGFMPPDRDGIGGGPGQRRLAGEVDEPAAEPPPVLVPPVPTAASPSGGSLHVGD